MGADDALEQALRQLKLEYLAEAPQRIAELRSLMAGATEKQPEALDGLKRAFHKLAGSGGSYGIPAVSETARVGEAAAQRLLQDSAPGEPSDFASIGTHIEAVAAAFESARAAEGM